MDDKTKTHARETDLAPDPIFEILCDPRHIPRWAGAFADGVVEGEHGTWIASKESRAFTVRVAANREARTVDYLRELSPGREGGAYIRVLPRAGGGSVVVMTVPVPPTGGSASVEATLRNELDELVRLASA
jgi:hypothetical protein